MMVQIQSHLPQHSMHMSQQLLLQSFLQLHQALQHRKHRLHHQRQQQQQQQQQGLILLYSALPQQTFGQVQHSPARSSSCAQHQHLQSQICPHQCGRLQTQHLQIIALPISMTSQMLMNSLHSLGSCQHSSCSVHPCHAWQLQRVLAATVVPAAATAAPALLRGCLCQ